MGACPCKSKSAKIVDDSGKYRARWEPEQDDGGLPLSALLACPFVVSLYNSGAFPSLVPLAAKAREEEDLRYMRERSIHAQLSPQDRQAVVASACGRLSEDAEERRARRSAKAKAVAVEGRKKMVHRGKRLSDEAEAGLLSRLYTPPPPSGRRAKAEELERVRQLKWPKKVWVMVGSVRDNVRLGQAQEARERLHSQLRKKAK